MERQKHIHPGEILFEESQQTQHGGYFLFGNSVKSWPGLQNDVGYSLPDFPFWSRDSFAISSSLEYNFNKNEFSFSLDLVIGVSW